MGKFLDPSEDIVKIVNEISTELGLDAYGLDVQPLCVTKASEVCKIVKANSLAEYATKRDNLIFVLCYEDVFEGRDREGHPIADEKTKYLWIRNAMETISYDTEKEKLILKCPMINIPLSFYEKFKDVAINSARLGLYTMAQVSELKKEEADRQKALKTKGKKRQ